MNSACVTGDHNGCPDTDDDTGACSCPCHLTIGGLRNRWQRFLHRGSCGMACPEHGWMAGMTNGKLLGLMQESGYDIPADLLPPVPPIIDEEP